MMRLYPMLDLLTKNNTASTIVRNLVISNVIHTPPANVVTQSHTVFSAHSLFSRGEKDDIFIFKNWLLSKQRESCDFYKKMKKRRKKDLGWIHLDFLYMKKDFI